MKGKSNRGDVAGWPTTKVKRRDFMRAYDRLPSVVRAALRRADNTFCAVQCRDKLASGEMTPDVCAAWLAHHDVRLNDHLRKAGIYAPRLDRRASDRDACRVVADRIEARSRAPARH